MLRAVLLILFLLAGSLSPPASAAQEAPVMIGEDEWEGAVLLEQNYPNPVRPETWIPFRLGPSLFESGSVVTATIRIHNILNQVVAIPEAMDHPGGRGTRVFNLQYDEPGRKIAYWDGKNEAGRMVPSGVYYMQLVVSGQQPLTKKLIVDNPRRRRSVFPW